MVEVFAGGVLVRRFRGGRWAGRWDGDGVADEVVAVVVGVGESVGFVGVAGDDDVAAVDVVVAGAAGGREVGGLGQAVVAVEPFDVVDLEAEGVVAAGGAAVVTVAVEDEAAEFGGDHFGGAADVDRLAAGGPHGADDAVAGDLVVEGLGDALVVDPGAFGVEVDVDAVAV